MLLGDAYFISPLQVRGKIGDFIKGVFAVFQGMLMFTDGSVIIIYPTIAQLLTLNSFSGEHVKQVLM